nr:helix-turn-helix domain-containing protein [Flavobacterium sp.]
MEHAKELLLSEYLDVLTVEGIGAKSGFASKSNFFAVFKESTGLSPIDFIAKNRKSTKNRKNDQE